MNKEFCSKNINESHYLLGLSIQEKIGYYKSQIMLQTCVIGFTFKKSLQIFLQNLFGFLIIGTQEVKHCSLFDMITSFDNSDTFLDIVFFQILLLIFIKFLQDFKNILRFLIDAIDNMQIFLIFKLIKLFPLLTIGYPILGPTAIRHQKPLNFPIDNINTFLHQLILLPLLIITILYKLIQIFNSIQTYILFHKIPII